MLDELKNHKDGTSQEERLAPAAAWARNSGGKPPLPDCSIRSGQNSLQRPNGFER